MRVPDPMSRRGYRLPSGSSTAKKSKWERERKRKRGKEIQLRGNAGEFDLLEGFSAVEM